MIIEHEALTLFLGGVCPDSVVPLHGDGSARRFLRILCGPVRHVLLVGPDPAENAAYVRVGRHLADRGVRVPAIRAVDESRGWILLEDLGDRNLFAAIRETRTESEVEALYGPVLDLLVRMQTAGSVGFDLSVGFASAPYDRELMLQWEGMYFAREFARGLLGLDVPDGFAADLGRLAEEAASAPSGYFLHRDFQSRNIQMTDDGPAVIDFQGARPGPLAYDASALILDPYAGHPPRRRQTLLASYLARLGREGGVDAAAVEASWFPIGTFRLLQALGAFGKLGGRLGKPGFLEHAATALDTLLEHLGERGRAEFPCLWQAVEEARSAWAPRGTRLTPPLRR